MSGKHLITVKNGSGTAVILPDISEQSESLLTMLTAALGIPRTILASEEEIQHAWDELPRMLKRIPPHLRDERIAKACVAVASGLFDAAINYVWNATIVELREKVRRFGINVVPQILDRDFDEDILLDQKDADLLDLCLRLNLIGDENFFFLDQCRATRNSFSVAHPSDGTLDDAEFIAFFARCQKHALTSQTDPKGVDTKALLQAIKGARFKNEQREEWTRRVKETFDAQRELIFTMLHGLYCDPALTEEARRNALDVAEEFCDSLSPKAQSGLLDRHQDYRAKGDNARAKASGEFFEKLGILDLLGEAELHATITNASKKLLDVHNAWDNFHNEPPFAERLATLAKDYAVPKSAQAQFVEAVVTCGAGNPYGVSRAANSYYRQMVKSFSPAEVKLMLELPSGKTVVAGRIANSSSCKSRYRTLVELLDADTVPVSAKSLYTKWTK